VQIGATDAAGVHPDQQFSVTGVGNRDVDEFETAAGPVELHGTHETSSGRDADADAEAQTQAKSIAKSSLLIPPISR
jgi:hypothetical protein